MSITKLAKTACAIAASRSKAAHADMRDSEDWSNHKEVSALRLKARRVLESHGVDTKQIAHECRACR